MLVILALSSVKFTKIFQLAFLAGLLVNAASAAKREALASNPTNELFRRAMPAPVLCGRKLNP